jgi:hypothetical protein
MANHKRDILKLIKDVEGQNTSVEVSMTGSGHWKLQVGSRPPVFLPRTPSDHRSLMDCKRKLRKVGISF